MKTVTTTRYHCETCGGTYLNKEDAQRCEDLPIKEDRGVKAGDIVMITAGEGTGERGTVTHTGVLSPGETHGNKKYIHTVYLHVNLIDTWGETDLLFNQYSILE